MSTLAHERKKERLNKELADLIEEERAVKNQYRMEVNAVNRVRQQRQLDDLDRQINEKNRALEALDASVGDANYQQLDLDKKLPRIDYQEIKTAFREIFGEEGECGCAALFLLQNSNVMGGKWGVHRMQELLIKEDEDRHFASYLIALTPMAQASEFSILDRLAEYMHLKDQPKDLKLYAQNIIRAIRDSLQGASIVFIEIKGWDFIKPPERALKWFLEDFWIPLAREMPTITQTYPQVKIVSVLVTDSEIVADGLDPYFGATNPFDSEKIIKLTLRKWTKSEIIKWLPARYPKLNAEQINNLAEHIFNSSSEGNPVMVYSALQQLSVQ